MNVFSYNLKVAINKAGMSQGDFAKAMGVCQSSVSCWVSGVRSPAITKLPKISRLLETTPNDLLGFHTGEAPVANMIAEMKNRLRAISDLATYE